MLKDQTRYWIEVSFKNRTYITGSNNIWKLYDYKVFDSVLDPVHIKENNLTCASLEENFKYQIFLEFGIRDKEGSYKSMRFEGANPSDRILAGVTYMKENGNFKNWEIIELKEEKKNLLKEIQIKDNLIKDLEDRIDEYKNKIRELQEALYKSESSR